MHSAPGELGELLRGEELVKAFVERGGVWTWLPEGASWSDAGARVRGAILDAVEKPGWEVSDGSQELLGLVAHDVIAGELASYIASHGGLISVADVQGDRVLLDLGGACDGCPAAGVTLRTRIHLAVASRYPKLVEIVPTSEEFSELARNAQKTGG